MENRFPLPEPVHIKLSYIRPQRQSRVLESILQTTFSNQHARKLEMNKEYFNPKNKLLGIIENHSPK